MAVSERSDRAFLVFSYLSLLRSLGVREKNATSEPEIMADSSNRITSIRNPNNSLISSVPTMITC